ncbi:hypothetical protein BBD42_11520 [Paenibacillus sp. BIHB 4019]|uniref:Uncharacterized protein n=1 Tax=Paenibacillus sp. BIHB 4019 TaxID=1870819 RepID=A0A1B2DH53_9BACL|nr:hypothetical protein BBD42_11520 [Paenibacillus sp. BIHB 4019]
MRWIAAELSGSHRLKRAKAEMPKLAASGADMLSGYSSRVGPRLNTRLCSMQMLWGLFYMDMRRPARQD